MFSSHRRGALLLALTAAGLVCGIGLAGPAEAATPVTVRMDGGVTVVTGTSGADSLRLEQVDGFGPTETVATVTITSQNGPLSAGAGCTATGGTSARCVTSQVSASLAGGDDLFRFVGTRPVFVFGGLGRDDISTSSGRDELSGGDGNDVLNAGGNSDRIRGGNGDDTCAGGETLSSC
jgi:Ca2+-binding RTX toxin-like protein